MAKKKGGSFFVGIFIHLILLVIFYYSFKDVIDTSKVEDAVQRLQIIISEEAQKQNGILLPTNEKGSP